MTYIAFLRGINVGGHTVKMDKMRSLFSDLGLRNVRSYIQSGNIFFDAAADTDDARRELTGVIEAHLERSLGYSVPVYLRTIAEVRSIIDSNPFRGRELTDDTRHCIVFMATSAPADLAVPLMAPKGDMEIVGVNGCEAFVIWHIVNGRPPASGSETFIGKALKYPGTTRFFHTTIKILEAAQQGAGTLP